MENIRKEETFSLGKKQLNKIADTIAGAAIIDLTEKIPISRQTVIKKLGEFSYIDTVFNHGNTNIYRPSVINSILGKESKKNNYTNGISSEDDILKITRCATNTCNNTKTPITFRMVYGATEQASLRSLSYPLPAMSMMKEISDNGNISPNMQIIFANNISGDLNNLDKNIASNESSKIIAGISHIAKEMGVENNIGFYYDNPNVDHDNLNHIAKEFSRIAPDQLLHTLTGKGSNDNFENTCRYAAAHYEIHDNPNSKLEHIKGVEISESINTIDIGGTQEKYYRAVRLLIADAMDSDVSSAQIYTKHHVPPYYMARGGDISLDNFANNADLDNDIAVAAKPDLVYLNNVIDLSKLRKEVYND